MSRRLFDPAPTHIVDAGAEHTRCGIPLYRKGAKPCPYVRAEFVQMHVDGRGMTVCPSCERGTTT